MFHANAMLHSPDIPVGVFFNHPMISQICDIMMRQGAFLNISFESQLINPPNLVNL